VPLVDCKLNAMGSRWILKAICRFLIYLSAGLEILQCRHKY